jgi:hypothetical protein
MRNGILNIKSISLKQKNKKRNKQSTKANKTRSFLLRYCDNELKESNKKNNQTLINSQTTVEYMTNFCQNFTITLEINNNDSNQYLIENPSPFKIIKPKYAPSFFDSKKLTIGLKKSKKFEKFLNIQKSHTDDEPLDSFFQDDSLSNDSCSSNDKDSFTKRYKKFISKKSFDYLRSIFHSIHKDYHNKLISAEVLDMLLNISLETLSKKKSDDVINGKKFRPKSVDLSRKRKKISEKKNFVRKDIFAIKLFKCLEE